MARIDDALLIKLYHEQPLAVDMLPYTSEMVTIHQGYNRVHRRHPQEIISLYRQLIALRKNGKLITKERPATEPEAPQGLLF